MQHKNQCNAVAAAAAAMATNDSTKVSGLIKSKLIVDANATICCAIDSTQLIHFESPESKIVHEREQEWE